MAKSYPIFSTYGQMQRVLNNLPTTPAEVPSTKPGPKPRGPFELDALDCRIMDRVAEGDSNEEISRILFLSLSAVERRAVRAYHVLGARNRVHAAAIYVRRQQSTTATAPYATGGEV